VGHLELLRQPRLANGTPLHFISSLLYSVVPVLSTFLCYLYAFSSLYPPLALALRLSLSLFFFLSALTGAANLRGSLVQERVHFRRSEPLSMRCTKCVNSPIASHIESCIVVVIVYCL
jgi:hypothetical protein